MERTSSCPRCGKTVEISATECAFCGIVFNKYNGDHTVEIMQIERARFSAPLLAEPLTVPLAFAFGYLMNLDWIGRMFVWLAIMPPHELGHAVASWSTGRFAMPLMFITWTFEPSSVFKMMYVAGLFGIGYWLYRRGENFLLILVMLALALTGYVGFRLPPDRATAVIASGGFMGEIVGATIFILGYYHRVLDRSEYLRNWKFFRYIFLIWGATAFVHCWKTWHAASLANSKLPIGSAVSDGDGDIGQLFEAGWGGHAISVFYLKAIHIAVIVIGLHYFFALLGRKAKAGRERAAP